MDTRPNTTLCKHIRSISFYDNHALHQENSDRRLIWTREVLDEAVDRLEGSTEVYLPENGYAMAIRVTAATRRNEQ